MYKAKWHELEVAVKTIHRQYVNPHLTPQQALQVIGQVTGCLAVPSVVHHMSLYLPDTTCTAQFCVFCSALVGAPSLHKHPVACALQELSILERLPFDRRVVQLYGSCTQEGNVLLVLEFMQVRV